MKHDPSYYPTLQDRPKSRLLTDGEFGPCLTLGTGTDPRLQFTDRETAIAYLVLLVEEASALAEALRRGWE